MERYWATIEYLCGQSAAIIELTDSRGEWAGGGRIDVRPINGDVRSALYEAGYVHASARASAKGGTLGRFSEFSKTDEEQCSFCGQDFRRCRCAPSPADCGQSVGVDQPRRPGNALNVEHFVACPTRCRLKMPEHWFGSGRSSLRWLGSDGSPLVFGACTPGARPKRVQS